MVWNVEIVFTRKNGLVARVKDGSFKAMFHENDSVTRKMSYFWCCSCFFSLNCL